MTDVPALVRAKLIAVDSEGKPVEGASSGEGSGEDSNSISVHFNPASLRYQISNAVKDNTRGGATSKSAAQSVGDSSASLAFELVFDTSAPRPAELETTGAGDASSDVRLETAKIVELFMLQKDGKRAPYKCRFAWGTFVFDGMIESYSETLDFFDPAGFPLRATVALTLKQDRYEALRESDVERRRSFGSAPTFAGTAPKRPLVTAQQEQGRDPKKWRETALYNGIEDPRHTPAGGILLPSSAVPSDLRGVTGFRFGGSERLGTAIPGAFPRTKP